MGRVRRGQVRQGRVGWGLVGTGRVETGPVGMGLYRTVRDGSIGYRLGRYRSGGDGSGGDGSGGDGSVAKKVAANPPFYWFLYLFRSIWGCPNGQKQHKKTIFLLFSTFSPKRIGLMIWLGPIFKL